MKKPTNKAECDALIKELQAMTFNELPKRWEEMEFLDGYFVNRSSDIEDAIASYLNLDNRNIFPTSDQAEASIYLAMLMQLRDVYREKFVPDWHDVKIKHCVILEENNWFVTIRQYHNHPFSFQTEERAELFLENFEDYLEKVKPLFS